MSKDDLIVPSWDGQNMSFAEYTKLVELWYIATTVPDEKKAPNLILRLTGTARAIALQTPTERFSKKDGVKTLMDILNQHFKKDEEDVMYEDIMRFIKFKRSDQDIHRYCADFRLNLTKVERHLHVNLPKKFVSTLLIAAANLSNTDRKRILSSVRNQLEHVDEVVHNMRRLFANPTPGDGQYNTLVLEENDLSSMEENDFSDASSMDSNEVQDTYVAIQSMKKRMNRWKNKKKQSKPKSKPTMAAESSGNPPDKVTGHTLRCFSCGSTEHLCPVCPKRKKWDVRNWSKKHSSSKSKEEMNLLATAFVGTAIPSNASSDTSIMIIDTGATQTLVSKNWLESHKIWMKKMGCEEPKIQPSNMRFRFGNGGVSKSLGEITLDVCIQGHWAKMKTEIVDVPCPALLSINSLAKLNAQLNFNAKSLTIPKIGRISLWRNQAGHFVLNMANPSKQKTKDVMVVMQEQWIGWTEAGSIGETEGTSTDTDVDSKMDAEDGGCPQIATPEEKMDTEIGSCSRYAMPQEHTVVDEDGQDMDEKCGSGSHHVSPQGLEKVSIEEIVLPKMESREEEGNEENETADINIASAAEIRSAKNPLVLRDMLDKIHRRYGHATPYQMKKLMNEIGNVPPETYIMCDKVVKNCGVCQLLEAHPPDPNVSHREAAHFCEKIETDLLFVDEDIFILYTDIATKWTLISQIKNKEPQTIWDDLTSNWLHHYGFPEQIISDKGGEYTSVWLADQCADHDILLNPKPKGSHAFGAEQRVDMVKKTMRKLRLEFPDITTKDIVWHTCRLLNEMIDANGISPDMAVFGRVPRNIANITMDDPCEVRFTQSIPAREVLISALRIRAMAQQCIAEELAKGRLKRISRMTDKFKGREVKVGDAILFYRMESKKSSARWCGPAEVILLQPQQVSISYQGQIRSVPRNWVKVYRDDSDDCGGDDTKDAKEWEIPIEWSGAPHTKKDPDIEMQQNDTIEKENNEEGEIQKEEMNEENQDKKSDGENWIDRLMKLTTPELREKCRSVGYGKNGSKRQLAMKYIERKTKIDNGDPEAQQFIENAKKYEEGRDAPGQIAFVEHANIVKYEIFKSEETQKCDSYFYDSEEIKMAFLAEKIRSSNELSEEEITSNKDEILIAQKKELDEWKAHCVYEEVEGHMVTKRILDNRWVYTWKTRMTEKNQMEKFIKARLVIKGFQDPDLGSNLIIFCATMAKKESHFLVLSVGVLKKWNTFQMDISTAFLKSDGFDRTVFTKNPTPETKTKLKVWKLATAVYGLNDAPSYFSKTLSTFLKAKDFWIEHSNIYCTVSKFDENVFIMWTKENDMACGIASCHVDDILVSSNAEAELEFENMITSRFGISKKKRLSESEGFTHCGLEIRLCKNRDVEVGQWKYIEELEEIKIVDANKKKNDEIDEQTYDAFRKALGKLAWLSTGSRPDIASLVGEMATRVNKLTYGDAFIVNKTIQKIKATKNEITIRFPAQMDVSKIQVLACGDGAMGNMKEKEPYGRAGGILMIGDSFPGGNVHTIGWNSTKLRNMIKNSLSAEVLAMSKILEMGDYLCDTLGDIFGTKINTIAINDCFSLFSCLTSTKSIEQKNINRFLIDIKNRLIDRVIHNWMWIDGKLNPSDGLTGYGKDNNSLEFLLKTNKFPFLKEFLWLHTNK